MRFVWCDRSYEGHDAEYNTTALNERAVELPIAIDWLGDRVLADGIEIGNVLGHYGLSRHRVIDLYEHGPNVENVDVRTLVGSFDWILAISTLEHVGEDAGDLGGPVAAIEHLRTLIAPGGSMLVTIPGGHNTVLDDYLANDSGASAAATLVRSGGRWVQTAVPQFLPYGYSTKWAESVWIGEWRNDGEHNDSDRTEPRRGSRAAPWSRDSG